MLVCIRMREKAAEVARSRDPQWDSDPPINRNLFYEGYEAGALAERQACARLHAELHDERAKRTLLLHQVRELESHWLFRLSDRVTRFLPGKVR